jgi:hypothetical protein
MAYFLPVFFLVSTAFILYATYKQDNDPDWAYGYVVAAIFIATFLSGSVGWKLGCKVEQDITFLAHWHVLGILMAAMCALVIFFISTIVLITGLAHKAYDKNWGKLATKLSRMINGRS